MRCPECGSYEHARYRSPSQVDQYLVRRHRCQKCKAIFLSAQTTLTGRSAELMLERMETPKPTPSSVPTRNGSAT